MHKFKAIAALSVALVMALSLAGLAGAAEKAAEKAAEPAFKQYTDIVKIDFVKQMVDGKTKGVLIDSRPARKKYDKGHIPGAINIPTTQWKKYVNLLPKDKETLLVFYCGGLKCALSHKAAYKAEALGYKNIKVFAEGYPVWKKTYGPGPKVEAKKEAAEPAFKQYPHIVKAAFVKSVVDGDKVGLVIDARPKRKMFDKGHIPGAISMPTTQFDKMKGLLPADKNALVVFYCGGLKCALSHKSAFKAEKLGYKNVKVFAEGYPVWTKTYGAGTAMAAAQPAAQPAAKGPFKAGKEEGSIDLDQFRKLVKESPDQALFIDVRDAVEYKAGSIKGAENIPVEKLEAKLKSGWKPEKPVVFVCGTGARSGEAYYMVADMRPELVPMTYYVDGEITFDGKGGCSVTPPKTK